MNRNKIIDYLATRKRQPLNIEASEGPFRYEYISISHVVGAKLPNDLPDPFQIAHFPKMNASAYLTHNWNEYYFHIDRAGAVATLILTGLVGIKRFKRLSRYINRFQQWICGPEWVLMRNLENEAARIKKKRLNSYSGLGCCLVYRAQGQIDQPIDLRASRKFTKVGIVLNAFDGSAIREEHHTNIRSVATAVSIAMTDTNGSPEVRFLADNIHLQSKDDLVIYARTIKAEAVGRVVTTMSSDEFVSSVATYIAGLSNDSKLSSAASLFAVSQYESNDNLRSFIASWSAFELLIFNLERKYRDVFQELLRSGSVELPIWDKDLSVIDISEYRLRDRFYAIACTINLTEAASDIRMFNEINSIRNDYYHRFMIRDTDLPTHDVQSLFRKYMKIELSSTVESSVN